MRVIRTGFDGLDVSYPLTISEDVAEELREARCVAQTSPHGIGGFTFGGVDMFVASSGAQGGYAFRADTGWGGPFGENWFFKEPNTSADQWGVRVSCRALPLALHGLAAVRARIEETLCALGMHYEPGTESIGRVDVACDILAPNFVADRNNIVSHSRTTNKEISDGPQLVAGRSSRVETILIGRNPNREVALYNKRAEVLATNKGFWWPIWNDALVGMGHPPIDLRDRKRSTVWRVEVRAFKRTLKDKWGVTTWADLREKLPAILKGALIEVRYTEPTEDSNRSRWPTHPLWALAGEAFSGDFQDLASMVDEAQIVELLREERDEMLRKQIAGCLLSRAALNRVPEHRLGEYALGCADQINREWQRKPEKTREKYQRARCRFEIP